MGGRAGGCIGFEQGHGEVVEMASGSEGGLPCSRSVVVDVVTRRMLSWSTRRLPPPCTLPSQRTSSVAMASWPRWLKRMRECVSQRNGSPYAASPPLPVPVGSPPCSMNLAMTRWKTVLS